MALFSVFLASIILVLSYRTLSKLLKKKLKASLTAVDDIPLLGIPQGHDKKIHGTAVICGGSIAGLLSARVCSDHFENVILVEAEHWVTTADGLRDRHRERGADNLPLYKRSRVPQYTSIHAFQVFTQLSLRRLFANFDKEVEKIGAQILPQDLNLHVSGVEVLTPPRSAFLEDKIPGVMYLTRPGYETTLRRLVLETCPNVKYISGSVTGFIPKKEGNRLRGVRIHSHEGKEVDLPACFVLDCTGPTRGGFRWLQEMSASIDSGPEAGLSIASLKSTYNPKVAYTTCEFDIPPRLFPVLKSIGVPGDYETQGNIYIYNADLTKEAKNFFISRRERNFLQIACGGWDLPEPTRNVEEIKAYISGISPTKPFPGWLGELLNLLQEEDVPFTSHYSRSPPSAYVRYHRAKNLPSNFVAVGDSVLQINPIRGQGCTKACVEAVTLNACLHRYKTTSSAYYNGYSLPDNFSRIYFAMQHARTGPLWSVYKSEDYAWKSTTPEKGDDKTTWGVWRRGYARYFIKLVGKDQDAAWVWWHIFNSIAPGTDMFAPDLVLKVVWMRVQAALGV